MNELEVDLFVSGCLELEKLIQKDCCNYSDRQCVSVFKTLLVGICKRQKNPKVAFDQILRILKQAFEDKYDAPT